MIQSFDYDAFDRLSMDLIVHSKGKSFAQLAGEIEALRKENEGIRDKSTRKYIQKNLDRCLLIFAIDTSQPPIIVDRLYKRCVRQGFNELHAEVASAIEYADYCREWNNSAKGSRALQKVREAICALCPGPSEKFLQVIDESISRFEENR